MRKRSFHIIYRNLSAKISRQVSSIESMITCPFSLEIRMDSPTTSKSSIVGNPLLFAEVACSPPYPSGRLSSKTPKLPQKGSNLAINKSDVKGNSKGDMENPTSSEYGKALIQQFQHQMNLINSHIHHRTEANAIYSGFQ